MWHFEQSIAIQLMESLKQALVSGSSISEIKSQKIPLVFNSRSRKHGED